MTIFASRPRARKMSRSLQVASGSASLRTTRTARAASPTATSELRATCDVALGQQWLHAVTTVTTIQRSYAELNMCIAAFPSLRTISEVCGSPQTEELLAPHDELIQLLVLPMRQEQLRETQAHPP